MGKPTYFNAVQILTDNKALHGKTNGGIDKIVFPKGFIPPTDAEVKTKLASMVSNYDAQAYARKRQAEYPSIQDLVVALYDTDDKTAIETKRAEVKAKYPKPE